MTNRFLKYREIVNDEANYTDARAFKPERYLRPDDSVDEQVIDPTNIVYGFGRRCVRVWLSVGEL